MELKRRFDWRKIFTILYIVIFGIYIIVGLQPAEARRYEISGEINIPSIGLYSDVTTLELNNHRLDTPDTIVGSYAKYSSKTLLIGHSSTVFKNLNQVKVGENIYYNGIEYKITKMETLSKDKIDMNLLLAPSKDNTLVVMTCAGERIGENDASHRLIVTAIKVF